ncbi:hypothetical protein CR513_54582, partial [Mucuna pruriens]
MDPALLCYPCDGEALKHFDRLHLQFSKDLRNVRLGLCADGFNPFGQYRKTPLIWTINDFPAYEMLFGWTTVERLGCPICIERTKAFTLKHIHKLRHHIFLPDCLVLICGRKLYTCHFRMTYKKKKKFLVMVFNIIRKKQSIFWRLPYWNTHLLHHNIDVMHTERNVFMNVFDTVMDINGRTKDTYKARMDIAEICNRKELELKDIGRWVKELKLPDGYASSLGGCVDVNQGNLHGIKSHDCHVFMQCLLPIHSTNYQNIFGTHLELTSTTLNVEKLTVMEGNIPMLLCKLEQILPPTFFDSMEHLPIYLPYEARSYEASCSI